MMLQLPSLTDAEFLRGTSTNDECKPMFDAYEKCLSVSLSANNARIRLTFTTESTVRTRYRQDAG
jgi:hypothetical protein